MDTPPPSLDPALKALAHTAALTTASAAAAAALTFLTCYLASRTTRLRWTWAPLLAPPPAAIAAAAAPEPLAALAGAAAATLAAASALAAAERRDELHGGRLRRRARAKRGPIQQIQAVRQRKAVTSGPTAAIDTRNRRIALGTDRTTGTPVWLSLDQLAKHVLILGATGSGKSNTLTWLTTRAIRAGYGAIVLDLKADPELRDRLHAEAAAAGRPYAHWRIEPDPTTYTYNPLRAGDATARRDRLVASQVFTEDYYRGLFSSHAKVVLDATAAAGIVPSLQRVADWWDPDDLKALTRRIASEDQRERLVRYLERLPKAQSEHVTSLRARLAEVTDTAAGEKLHSAEGVDWAADAATAAAPAGEIVLAEALRERAIVVFSLNADTYAYAAATLASLILQDLVGTAGAFRQAREPGQSVIAVDEFGALSGEQLGRLLSTARDVGLPTLLAGQDLAQLRRISEHFEAEVKANVCAVIAHRQSEPDSAEQIARICGTEEVATQTAQVDRRRLGVWEGGASRHETGMGSQHHERQFRVEPDEIKDLATGEAVVRAWNPPSAHVVRMFQCERSWRAVG